MKKIGIRFIKLIGGLFLYSLGILCTINANIGYSPWDIFHVGLANTLNISIGIATIFTGLAIGILAIILGEKVGIGTLLNMLLIGFFIDLLMKLGIIHKTENFFIGILMMIIGLSVIALATFLYISSGFGAGPRDSLLVAITKKTNLQIGLCRGIIEFSALIIGWKLGGKVGFGTVLSAGAIGLFIQIVFKILKFDATDIKHETFNQTYTSVLKNLVK